MSDLPVSVNRDLLCVTPQHEDESYLSPSEEDLRRSYSNRAGGFLNCKPPNFLNINSGVKSLSANEEEATPWEDLSFAPCTKEEHLSWDRLMLPVPYDEHRSCVRQVRKSPATLYVTDDTKNQASIGEKIWRSYGQVPHVNQSATGGRERKHSTFHYEALRKVQSVGQAPIYIPPKQFVQHIFHLLCGRESLSFSRLPAERYSFTRNPKVLITGMSPGLVTNLSEEYLISGRIYKRLTHVSALHYDEKLMDREGFGNNAVITAFLKFTSDYLKLYQTSLMLKAVSITTFGNLGIFFKPFRQQLATLEKILDLYLATNQITLLKGLNTMMLSSETPFVADLVRSAFITCAAAYLRYVADWVFRGSLTKGFHIQRTKSFNYQDRRYWIKQFSRTEDVPKFLDSVLNIIFETAKAINLLNLIRNAQPRTSLLSSILIDEGTVIHPAVEFSQVTLLEKDWQIKLESFFEEYSFLQEDIASALVSEDEEKQSIIDFDVIEDAKKSFELKQSLSRRQVLDKKLEKQRILFNALSQQLAEKKDREKQESDNDLMENEKIASFLKKRDQRDLEEEIRLKNKHFGGKIFDTVGMRNIKERIAATKEEELVKTSDHSHNLIHSSDSDKTDHDIMGKIVLAEDCESVSSELQELTIDSNHEQEGSEQSFEDVVSVKSTDLRRTLRNDLISNSDDVRHISELDSLSSTDRTPADHDCKFNPNKLKVRSTVPYNTNLDFNISAFETLPQPLLRLNKSFSFVQDDDEDSTLRHDSFFLNYFFQQSAIIPVTAQYRMVNATLLHYFIVEKKLFHHMEALNSYLCLQNGLFGHFLTTLLIQEIKNGTFVNKDDFPRKSTRLNEILGVAVALSAEGNNRSETRDNLGFILACENNRSSVDLDNQKPVKSKILSSNYEILDDITLNYSVEWPLSILLTEDLLINYEKLFTFQMKLYRAELLLLEMLAVLKQKGNTSKQLSVLHYYRYRMLHFVRSVRHYINVTVIHCAWTELVSSFPKMNSLDKPYEGLVRHIKTVTTNCLLGTKGEAVKKLLVDQLIVIECFCTEFESCSKDVAWNAGEEISPHEFNQLTKKYKVWEEIQKVFLRVFLKLAEKGIYQKVSYFLQLFNFNEYFGSNSLLE